MDNFKKDINGIFQECEDSLLWYLDEYNLNPQEMKKIFIDYAKEWFNKIIKQKEKTNEED